MRWNWDAPFIISPHSNTRLYFGAQTPLSQRRPRRYLDAPSVPISRASSTATSCPLMGKVWPIDAIQKNVSTALYDNISSIAESPKKEGLIYVGTDDGLVQVTEDGGKNWRKVDKPAGVPEDAYVQRIVASQHDAGTVYVAYENHQNGDFKPYLIKSTDTGKTWVNISGNLPERGGVYAIAEDHVNKNLLFAGTEFGLYFTNIGGEKWIKLNVGLPTIMVRDLAIQKQMDDLVIGTFGRSIYVLDDYSPLRVATPEMMQKESAIFPVRKALSYHPVQSAAAIWARNHFTAPNPPVGALITFNLKDAHPHQGAGAAAARARRRSQRGETPAYPTPEELRAEALGRSRRRSSSPSRIPQATSFAGSTLRPRAAFIASPGICAAKASRWRPRFRWRRRAVGGGAAALAVAAVAAGGGAVAAGGGGGGGDAARRSAGCAGGGGGGGPLVVPGKYTVSLAKRVDGVVTALPGSADRRSRRPTARPRRKTASPWPNSRTSSANCRRP